jgi:dTDP-D-glucose 4,6-dehydratase
MLSELINEGHNVTVFNRQLSIPPDPFPEATKFVKGDRNSPIDLENLFTQSYDVIIDISGFTPKHVDPIISNYSSKIGQYIFISTSSVYKKPLAIPINEESPRVSLKNTYGGDKALVENLLLNKQRELSVTIFRPSGVFGPYEPLMAGLIFYRIINGLPIFLGKNTNVQAQQLYVFDLIKAVSLSMGNPKAFGKTYNIVGDESLTLMEFIELCGKVCTKKPILKYLESVSQFNDLGFVTKKRHANYYAEWPESDVNYANNLIKQDLNNRFTSIEESLRNTYSWLKNNPHYLNYFSLRAEKYILYNRPVPGYYKIVWIIIDCLNNYHKKFKDKLRNYDLIRKNVHRFKNIRVTRLKLRNYSGPHK